MSAPRSATLRGHALLDLLARQGVPPVDPLAVARDMLRLAQLDIEAAAGGES